MDNSISQNIKDVLGKDECYNSNPQNPYMNYLNLGNDMNRPKHCDTSTEEIKKNFYEGMSLNKPFNSSNDLTKHFYTNPVTTVTNDQTKFAKFLFPNTASCRDSNYLCKIDNTQNPDRIVYRHDSNSSNYLDISEIYRK